MTDLRLIILVRVELSEVGLHFFELRQISVVSKVHLIIALNGLIGGATTFGIGINQKDVR